MFPLLGVFAALPCMAHDGGQRVALGYTAFCLFLAWVLVFSRLESDRGESLCPAYLPAVMLCLSMIVALCAADACVGSWCASICSRRSCACAFRWRSDV
jgi:hypothetical protein